MSEERRTAPKGIDDVERSMSRMPWSTIVGFTLSLILAVALIRFEEHLKEPTFAVVSIVLAVLLAAIFAFIDLFENFRRGIEAEFNKKFADKLDVIEGAIASLPFYTDFVAYTANEGARQAFLDMMRRQSGLQAMGRAEVAQIVAATRSRHLEELAVSATGDITLRVPSVKTYAIYSAIWDAKLETELLITVDCVDLDWWVHGQEPNLYIQSNRRALAEGRVNSIKRLFIIERKQWNDKSKEHLTRVRNQILMGDERDKIRLFAIFDDQIRDGHLRKFDVIIRAKNLAIQWEHSDDDSYPKLNIFVNPSEVGDLMARAEVLFNYPQAKPIDEFLTSSEIGTLRGT